MIYLLDTNIISELRKGARADPNVRRWAATVPEHDLATSVVVIAEITRGIEMLRRRDSARAAALSHWFETVRRKMAGRILPIDEPIAELWGKLSVPSTLPFMDGMLAATAMVRGLVLVTRNVGDVDRTGVKVLNPFEG